MRLGELARSRRAASTFAVISAAVVVAMAWVPEAAMRAGDRVHDARSRAPRVHSDLENQDKQQLLKVLSRVPGFDAELLASVDEAYEDVCDVQPGMHTLMELGRSQAFVRAARAWRLSTRRAAKQVVAEYGCAAAGSAEADHGQPG